MLSSNSDHLALHLPQPGAIAPDGPIPCPNPMNASKPLPLASDRHRDHKSREPSSRSRSRSQSHSESDDQDMDDSDRSDQEDQDVDRYRHFRAPSPIPLRTNALSGMTGNFGSSDSPAPVLPLPSLSEARPRAHAGLEHAFVPPTRGSRNLGYGVELGLEFPDVPRFDAASRPPRVDSAWATASKLQERTQPLPTVDDDDPLASFAIPMLSNVNTLPKSAFAPSPAHHLAAEPKLKQPTQANQDRIAQLRAAILDVSADQARDHLRSRQLFTQHRPHIDSLVQRLFTVHETDPYFVARSLALLAKFDTPYKRQRVLLTLDAMDQDMTKDEERELLGFDDASPWASSAGKEQGNAYLHSLHAASSAVKDSLHAQPAQSLRRHKSTADASLSCSSLSPPPSSSSNGRRERRGRPRTKPNSVEPLRVRASIGSTIPLFPTDALGVQRRAPTSKLRNPSSSPSHRSRRPLVDVMQRQGGRGEDSDSTATCTSVSSSASASENDPMDDGQCVDLNALLLSGATLDDVACTGGATTMIRNQLTQERQRLLQEQEQLRDMLAELQRDVSVMERVASIQAQREKELMGVEQDSDDDQQAGQEKQDDKAKADPNVKNSDVLDVAVVDNESSTLGAEKTVDQM